MTHQELLAEWFSARLTVISEFGSTTSDGLKACEKAIIYARENGLLVPDEVKEKVRDISAWYDNCDLSTEDNQRLMWLRRNIVLCNSQRGSQKP